MLACWHSRAARSPPTSVRAARPAIRPGGRHPHRRGRLRRAHALAPALHHQRRQAGQQHRRRRRGQRGWKAAARLAAGRDVLERRRAAARPQRRERRRRLRVRGGQRVLSRAGLPRFRHRQSVVGGLRVVVMRRAGVPGFIPSGGHFDYVRGAAGPRRQPLPVPSADGGAAGGRRPALRYAHRPRLRPPGAGARHRQRRHRAGDALRHRGRGGCGRRCQGLSDRRQRAQGGDHARAQPQCQRPFLGACSSAARMAWNVCRIPCPPATSTARTGRCCSKLKPQAQLAQLGRANRLPTRRCRTPRRRRQDCA